MMIAGVERYGEEERQWRSHRLYKITMNYKERTDSKGVLNGKISNEI